MAMDNNVIKGPTAVERAMALEGQDETTNILKQFFPEDASLWMKTEIAPGQLMPLVALAVQMKAAKSKIGLMFIKTLLTAQISLDRKGRDEFLEAMSIQNSKDENDEM